MGGALKKNLCPKNLLINHRPERMPPQAVEIEQAVLGAMMLEQHAVGHALEILDPSCFYNATHSRIFETMISLYERGVAVDQFTLAEELKRRDQLDDVGGVVYLVKLATQVATAANTDVHARIVQRKGTQPPSSSRPPATSSSKPTKAAGTY